MGVRVRACSTHHYVGLAVCELRELTDGPGRRTPGAPRCVPEVKASVPREGA